MAKVTASCSIEGFSIAAIDLCISAFSPNRNIASDAKTLAKTDAGCGKRRNWGKKKARGFEYRKAL